MKKILTTILALSVVSTAVADNKEIKSATVQPEHIVVFGDSLSDAGYQNILQIITLTGQIYQLNKILSNLHYKSCIRQYSMATVLSGRL